MIVQVSSLSVLKKVSGAYFSQTQTKLAVVVTEKPLLGVVNKILPLPLLYHLHRVEDDATNRVTFDYWEIRPNSSHNKQTSTR